MNFNKLAFLTILATCTTAAMGQSFTTRNFYYDGSTATNGNALYIVNGDGPNPGLYAGANLGTVWNNNVYGATSSNAGFLAQTLINVATYVYINGNFGGVYTVSGIGAAQEAVTNNNDIEVRTNRSLTFTANGFSGIANNVGQINYTLSLFQDYPSNGVQIGPGGVGTDAGFNGVTVGLNASYALPADGKATLRLTRNLILNQAALGGHQYTAAGFIQVGVN